MATSKQDVLDILAGVKQSTLLGYVLFEHAQQLGMHEVSSKCLNSPAFRIAAKSGQRSEDLRNLGYILSLPETHDERRAVRGNYFLLLDFSLLRTTFEVIKEYCEATSQMPVLQASGDLYRIARVARNLVSHGEGAELANWPDNYKKQGIRSVTWGDLTISESDVGKEVYIDTRQTLMLHDALREYVRDHLK